MPGASNYLEFSYKLFDALKRSIIWLEETLSADWSKEQALRDAGVVAVYMAADMADNHGLFLIQKQMDRVYPALHQENGGETERDGNVCHVTHRW